MIAKFIFGIFLIASVPDQPIPGQLFGKWKVTAIANAGPMAAMSGSAAHRLVGKLLVLSPHRLQFANATCNPSYEASSQTLADFAQDLKFDPKTLHWPDPITRLDADCTELFVPSADTIFFEWDGFFFEAHKAARKR